MGMGKTHIDIHTYSYMYIYININCIYVFTLSCGLKTWPYSQFGNYSLLRIHCKHAHASRHYRCAEVLLRVTPSQSDTGDGLPMPSWWTLSTTMETASAALTPRRVRGRHTPITRLLHFSSPAAFYWFLVVIGFIIVFCLFHIVCHSVLHILLTFISGLAIKTKTDLSLFLFLSLFVCLSLRSFIVQLFLFQT